MTADRVARLGRPTRLPPEEAPMKMPRLLRAALPALSLLVFAGPAPAAVEMLNIDQSHTNVGFSIRHFFTPVKGEFREVKGTIAYDLENPSQSKVEVTIPSASINTNHEKRDTHLRSADFFDAEKNPTITFVSKSIALDAKTNKGTMTGDLTMRGVTKPVTLDVEMLGIMGAGAGKVAGFTARGKVNRKDYGILWNRTLDQGGTMLADDVDLNIDVEAKTPPPPKPAENAAATPAPATAPAGETKK
jgi:polyisoprenoid-binding protein YceI